VKFSARELVLPLIAVAVLALMLQQTLAALRDSGSWQARPRVPRAVTNDPYTRVDELFAQNQVDTRLDGLRNPFAFGAAKVVPVEDNHHTVVRVAPHPPAPAQPTLTAIIWDNDPRASVRYDGRDFSVRVNSLFADFRVKSISADQVVLDRNGETIVLGLRPKGD
jgi:hypothetical protein